MAQTKENDDSGGAPQNDPMPRIVTSNQINQARHNIDALSHNWGSRNQQDLTNQSVS